MYTSTHIEPGWTLVGSDGANIGEVKQVHEDHIVVSGGVLLKHNLYVPIDHLSIAADGKAAVNIPANQVDAEGWRYPPNAGFDHEKPAYPEVPDTTMIQAAGYSAGHLSAPEVQGAILDDGLADSDEVPGTDLSASDTPGAVDDEDAR